MSTENPPTSVRRLRAMRRGPEAYEAWKARRTAKKRAQRARRHAAGLRADGKPLKNHQTSEALLRAHGHHPERCPCYDCLWGKPEPVEARRPVRVSISA